MVTVTAVTVTARIFPFSKKKQIIFFSVSEKLVIFAIELLAGDTPLTSLRVTIV